jgi:hypothetical protein
MTDTSKSKEQIQILSRVEELEKAAIEAKNALETYKTETDDVMKWPSGPEDVVLYKGRHYTQVPISDLSIPLQPIGGGDTIRVTLGDVFKANKDGVAAMRRHRYQVGMVTGVGVLKRPVAVNNGCLVWGASNGLFLEPEADGEIYSNPPGIDEEI